MNPPNKMKKNEKKTYEANQYVKKWRFHAEPPCDSVAPPQKNAEAPQNHREAPQKTVGKCIVHTPPLNIPCT